MYARARGRPHGRKEGPLSGLAGGLALLGCLCKVGTKRGCSKSQAFWKWRACGIFHVRVGKASSYRREIKFCIFFQAGSEGVVIFLWSAYPLASHPVSTWFSGYLIFFPFPGPSPYTISVGDGGKVHFFPVWICNWPSIIQMPVRLCICFLTHYSMEIFLPRC